MYLRSMYLYNITIIAEDDIGEAVMQHLHAELSGFGNTKSSLSLLELLDSPHEGTTLCVQLRCREKGDIVTFQTDRLAKIQTDLSGKYPGKVVFFDSTMRYLND